MKAPLFPTCFIACLLWIALSSISAKAQVMTYKKGGTVSFEGKNFSKPRELTPLIEQKNDQALTTAFNSYRTNRGFGNVLGFVGGLGVGWSIGSLIGGGKLNGGLLAGGAATIGIGALLSSSANRSLQRVVELYNGGTVSKLSLLPTIKADGYTTEIGVNVRF